MSLSKTLPASTATRLPSSASQPPPPAPLCYLEFRSPEDDAWYSVSTVLDGQKLIVKYQNFTDDHDQVLSPDGFRSFEDLLSFRHRFRCVSTQVQDNECYSLAPNAVLCTSRSSSSTVIFYDAVLEQVIHKKHRFENGEERCLCKFLVVWKHGPLAGCLAVKAVEDLCLVDPTPWLDDNVASFINIVKEKLGITAVDKNLLLPSKGGDARSPSGTNSAFAQKFRLPRTKCARRSLPRDLLQVEEAERPAGCIEKSGEDSDVGGGGSHFVMFIENLQKDLSPSAIEAFIYRQTSIAVKAYVYPSLAFETYTKAAIVLECQRDRENLCQFLDNPNHIIMSQKGSRPWVVSGTPSGCNGFMGQIQALIFKYQNKLPRRSVCMDEELKLVPSESEEYAAAKQLRDLFVEFIEHQRGLHRRLAMEEEKVLQPPKY